MNCKDLEKIIESLAQEVINVEMPPPVSYGEVPNPPEWKNVKQSKVKRISCRHYGDWDWKDASTEHHVCVDVLKQVVQRIPCGPSTLLWRVRPEYEEDVDFASRRERHRVYCRLGWNDGIFESED